ncbi:MAG: hypothetical protein WCG21_11885 [Eubacteriales bacterium]
MDEITADNENKEARSKEAIALAYRQARWFAFSVNEPKKMPTLQQEFPDLFPDQDEEPKKKKVKKGKKTEQWEIDKARMAIYASAHNAQFLDRKE